MGLARARARVPRRPRSHGRRRGAVPDGAQRERRFQRARSRVSPRHGPRARRRPAHVRRHRAHARPDDDGGTACRERRRKQRASRPRCRCRPTSTCSCATAACSISMPRAASRGTSRTSPAACGATTTCLTIEARALARRRVRRPHRGDGAGVRRRRRRRGATFTGDWRLSADLDGVDLAVAARLFPPSAVAPQTGRGDVAVWLNWQEGALAGGTVDLALADVTLQSALGAVDSRFERIALSGNWQRTSDTWNFALRDVAVTRSDRAWPEAATVDIDVVRDADGVDALRAAQQLPAARGPDAVLRPAAGVAAARLVVRARAARRSARRRPRADARPTTASNIRWPRNSRSSASRSSKSCPA